MTITEIAQLHTMRQIADACRVKRQTVYNWIRLGRSAPTGNVKLAATKIGGQYLIRPDDLAAFVARLNAPVPAPHPASAAKAKRRAAAATRALSQRVS